MLLQRVTRDGATRRLMTTYVTVLPYRYKLNSHPVQYNMMCRVSRHAVDVVRGPWTSCRLLGVDVHVLWVAQQANPLLLLPLLRHLVINGKDRFK